MTHGTITLTYIQAPWYIRLLAFFRKKTHSIAIPQNWKEVDPDKMEAVFESLAGRESAESVETELLLDIVDVPSRLLLQLGAEEVAERLLPFLSWMLTEPLLEPTLTTIRVDDLDFKVAKPYFKEQKLAWYRECDTALENLKNSPLEPKLDEFLGAYFSTSPEKMANIAHGHAYFVLFYYMSTRQWMFDEYLPEPKTDPSKKTATMATRDQIDWDELYIDLANRGTFGPLHRIPDIPVVSFFAWMGKNHREYLAAQKKALQDAIKHHHQNYVA